MENKERNEKNKQRLQYLETNVKPILEPLIFSITKEKPEDPIVYAINWLRKYVGKCGLYTKKCKNQIQAFNNKIKTQF